MNEWDATKMNSMDDAKRDPLFVWWHTLSHALIRALSLYSGYSSSALRERVYLDDSEGQKQGGILIFTVMSGEDGGDGWAHRSCDRFWRYTDERHKINCPLRSATRAPRQADSRKELQRRCLP